MGGCRRDGAGAECCWTRPAKDPPETAKQNLATFVQPEYPPLAKAARIAGVVHTSIVINETGNVKNRTLISGHMLAPSALQAIKKWKYKPFQVDGKTAAVQAEVEVSVLENITQSDIDKEGNFQEAYGPNEGAGREALGKRNLATAEAKLLIARAAAEERGEQKWLELAGVISMLGAVKLQQDYFGEAEQLCKHSLGIHEKHQTPGRGRGCGCTEKSWTTLYAQETTREGRATLPAIGKEL